ncbi:MAG: FAD-dependent monooxygenase, partial [Solirubrobacterales bacterium]|nr:FAD-dependent monooxygenase [Solirubrobacterales bacterium]
WEFMLLPHEQPSDFEDPERVWALLEPWYRPEDGPLTRSTVYEFRSKVAERMRTGRMLIVGDAAHLTPPFLGQGLCSGLRDAANVAWKLDLVLRGLASERLLDTVERERQPQNEAVIRFAIELGKVLCQLDPKAAAERDVMLREAGPPPPLELAPLTAGLLHQPIGEPDPLAGTLSVQGVVEHAGQEGRFDDVVGRGFQLIVADGDPFEHLSSRHRTLLDMLGATVTSLDPAAPRGVRDRDGRLTAWLSAHNAHAVLIRPDFYVFGGAASAEAVPDLLDDLHTQLQIKFTAATSGALR